MHADLIARLEAATGPDRELDWRIADAIGHPSFAMKIVMWPPLSIGSRADRYVPRYTSSIDAARTLSNWLLVHASDIGADGLPLVRIANPGATPVGEVDGIAFGGGKNALARAYCAAALRALEATNARQP